jgi:hypothetical protein
MFHFVRVRPRLARVFVLLVAVLASFFLIRKWWFSQFQVDGSSVKSAFFYLRDVWRFAHTAPVIPASNDRILEVGKAPDLDEAHGWEPYQAAECLGGKGAATYQQGAELTLPVDLEPGTYTLFLRSQSAPGRASSRIEVKAGGQTCAFSWRQRHFGNVLEPSQTLVLPKAARQLHLRVTGVGENGLILDRLMIRPGPVAEGDSWLIYLGIAAAVAALLAGAAGWGAFLWGRLGLGEESDPLVRLVLQQALGLGLIATITTVLGIVGCFRVVVVATLLAGGLMCGGRSFGSTAAAWLAEQRRRFSIRHSLAIMVLLLGVAALAALALTPATGIDPQLYHLPVAKWLITEGSFHYHPYHAAWAYPHNISNLFAVTQLLDNDPYFRTAQLTHASLGVVWLVSVYALGKTLFGRATGLAAGVLCVAIDGVPWEFGGAVVDLGFACFAGTALLGFVNALKETDEKRRGRWLVLAALLAGVAAVCKVNGPTIAVALATASGLWLGCSRGWRASLGWFCVIGLVSFAVASPMYLKNWLLYYNPVYPFTTLFPNRDWPADFQRAWFNDQRNTDWRIMFGGPYPFWLWPYAWMKGKFMEPMSPGPGLLVAVLLVPLLGRDWLRRYWPLLLSIGLLAALWIIISPLTRFTYPWVAVLLVLACAPLSYRRLRWPGLAIPIALVFFGMLNIGLQAEGVTHQWVHLVRRQSNETYLRWLEPGTNTLSAAMFDDIKQLNQEYRQQPWKGRVLIDAVHLAYADFRAVPAPTYLMNRANGLQQFRRIAGADGSATFCQYSTWLSDRALLNELTQRLQVRRIVVSKQAGDPSPALQHQGSEKAGTNTRPERPLDAILEAWVRSGLVQKRPLTASVIYTFNEAALQEILDGRSRQAKADSLPGKINHGAH